MFIGKTSNVTGKHNLESKVHCELTPKIIPIQKYQQHKPIPTPHPRPSTSYLEHKSMEGRDLQTDTPSGLPHRAR